jgi:hypothetical protein
MIEANKKKTKEQENHEFLQKLFLLLFMFDP